MRAFKVSGVVFAAIMSWAFPAAATHYLGGAISYEIPDPQGAPTTVQFEIVAHQVLGGIGVSGMFAFGDGTSAPLPSPVKISQGAVPGEVLWYTLTHTYPMQGAYSAAYNDCCLSSTIENSGDSFYRLQAMVDLTNGNTASALSFTSPLVQLQVNGVRSFFIPAKDNDGVPVSCRFSTTAESGVSINPPKSVIAGLSPTVTASANPPGCIVTWDLNGTQAAKKYALGLMMESMNGANMASVPVQFMVETLFAPPPTCSPDGVIKGDVGVPVNASFTGTNMSGGANLMLGFIGSVGGLGPNPGAMGASPFGSSLQWTPGPTDAGLHLLHVVYSDQLNGHGTCSTFVDVAACPQYGTACSAGVGACLQNSIMKCTNGMPYCAAVPGMPSPETCNGLDDDCDGNADDGLGLGNACTVGVGACVATGMLVCDNNGGVVCSVSAGMPAMETCNGIDDDCDGVVDDGCAGAGGMGAGGAGGAGGMGGSGVSNSSSGSPAIPPQQAEGASACAYEPKSTGSHSTALGSLLAAAIFAMRRRRAS